MSHRLVFLPLIFLLLWDLPGASASAQGGTHRAALLVRYPDGSIQTRCVAFNEPSITGEELLLRSGLNVIMNYNAGLGGAVCSINGSGCSFPREDCFCRCQGVQCEYWAYYHWTGGGWEYSQVGASSYQVSDDALEGWSWGPGTYGTAGTLPPVVPFDQICTSPTSTPTATATASPTETRTSTPTATATSAAAAGTTYLPQISFETTASVLTSGACTVLKWIAWDATRVMLDGVPVLAQDRLEVCPTATQRYVLVAINSAGQITRELTIAVTETATPRPSHAAMPSVTASPPRIGTATGLPKTEVPKDAGRAATQSVQTPAPLQTATGTLVHGGPLLTPVAPAAAPDSEPQPASPEPGAASSPQLATSVRVQPTTMLMSPVTTPTVLLRRVSKAKGPTPTPILVARASSGDISGPNIPVQDLSDRPGSALSTPDRSFSTSLLPGYAAYLLIAGLILGSGVVITRRKT